jgi:hypothetical protein
LGSEIEIDSTRPIIDLIDPAPSEEVVTINPSG